MAIFVAVMLAVAVPIVWQSFRMYAEIGRRAATLAAEQRSIRYTAALLPLLFDLQVLRVSASQPDAALHTPVTTTPVSTLDPVANLRLRISAESERLGGGADRLIPAASCGISWSTWRRNLAGALRSSHTAVLAPLITQATCFVTDQMSKSELGYDNDQTVQVLASLVGLNIPGMVRRTGLTASLLETNAPGGYDRAELLETSRLLGTVGRLQKNIDTLIEDDLSHDDAVLARSMALLEQPAHAAEGRFESASDALLLAPVIAAGATTTIEQLAVRSTDALRPVADRSLDEMARRIAVEERALRSQTTQLVVFASLALTIAAIVMLLAARFFNRRHARELRRVEAALADHLGRATAERALSLTEGQLRAVFESSSAAIVIFDDQLRVVQANRSFSDLQTRHVDIETVVRQRLTPPFPNVASPARSDIQLGYANGQLTFLDMSVAGVFEGPRCAYVIATIADVTDAKAQERRLYDESRRDPLTGLANRTGFGERFAALHARAPTANALFFIDLDRFKPINDRFGHAAGDAVLIAVGARLRSVVAAADVVARLGGDEFAVIVEDVVDEDVAASIAQRMMAAIQMPIAIASGIVDVAASIGIALDRYDDARRAPAELLTRADAAMYRAKIDGSGYAIDSISSVGTS